MALSRQLNVVVLDSWAVMAYFQGEPSAGMVFCRCAEWSGAPPLPVTLVLRKREFYRVRGTCGLTVQRIENITMAEISAGSAAARNSCWADH